MGVSEKTCRLTHGRRVQKATMAEQTRACASFNVSDKGTVCFKAMLEHKHLLKIGYPEHEAEKMESAILFVIAANMTF